MYLREVNASDFPTNLIDTWADNYAMFNAFAKLLEDEIKTQIGAMIQPFTKLAESVKVTAMNNGVMVQMDDYGKFLDLGTKPRSMTSHVDKTIPIDGKDGSVVYRKVRAGDIAQGKWYHPGIAPMHFVDVAILNVVGLMEANVVQMRAI